MCRELPISKMMVYLFIKLLIFFLQQEEKTAKELRSMQIEEL
jgi:hypothetical protein